MEHDSNLLLCPNCLDAEKGKYTLKCPKCNELVYERGGMQEIEGENMCGACYDEIMMKKEVRKTQKQFIKTNLFKLIIIGLTIGGVAIMVLFAR